MAKPTIAQADLYGLSEFWQGTCSKQHRAHRIQMLRAAFSWHVYPLLTPEERYSVIVAEQVAFPNTWEYRASGNLRFDTLIFRVVGPGVSHRITAEAINRVRAAKAILTKKYGEQPRFHRQLTRQESRESFRGVL